MRLRVFLVYRENTQETRRNPACNPIKVYTVHKESLASSFALIRLAEERPKIDPKVWLAAKRYPVADPYPSGNTTYDE